jgi:hypothetical protein
MLAISYELAPRLLPVVLALAPLPCAAQDSHATVAGTWMADGFPERMQTVDGKVPPLTAKGAKIYRANQADRASDQPQFDRTRWCAGPGVPRIMLMPYPFEIIVNPKLVGFVYGWYRWHRAVDMSGQPAEPVLPQTMGYPVGHWEGETLVIESNGLTSDTILDDSGLPHSDDLLLGERIEPLPGDRLRIRFRITDPEIYSSPWETEMTYHRPKGVTVGDDICPDRIARGQPAIAYPEESAR